MKLLTPPAYSHKTELGLAKGIGQAILYLAPAFEAYPDKSRNLCPGHSPECFRNCLIHSGQMIMPHAHAARVRKTKLLLEQPEEFETLLVKDIDAHLRWCTRQELAPAFRFNGTSDYPFEDWAMPISGETVHQYLLRQSPEAVINEYTKRYTVMKRWLEGVFPKNVHMTFSLHELNERQARQILHLGGNVAIVFAVKKGTPLPTSWWGHPVVDGDTDDLRWLDGARAQQQGASVTRGLVVALRAKGILSRRSSPFALDPQLDSQSSILLPVAA